MGNRLYVGVHDSGKTTSLYRHIGVARNARRPVVVIDSATDHKDRSLFYRLLTWHADDCVGIEYPRTAANPTQRLSETVLDAETGKVVMIDVSFYLEEGHRLMDPKEKRVTRRRYQDEAADVLGVVCDRMSIGGLRNVLVVMDEIELTTGIVSCARTIAKHGGEVHVALHPPLVAYELSDEFERFVL